ncbi:hypothetical protein HYS93_01915 [Candidatus Daviesbacteria bacterium]|nr:hypothetical protein [Candidatus Daviesbacteria bacterium]
MNQKFKKNKNDSFQQQDLPKSILPPIFYLYDSFRKSLEQAIGKKIPKNLEEIISVDLTPTHVEGDFTFPIFEIAKVLKVDYSKLASDIVKNLKSYKRYIQEVKIVNGYINVTVKSKKFYTYSLRHVLNENLLREANKSKKIKTVLLITEQVKTDTPVNGPVFQFINRLYALSPYTVKTASINKEAPIRKTRSFLFRVIKNRKIRNFGNDVIAIHQSEERYLLLQKQDKSPTQLLSQLTSLSTHLKENNPDIIIFSLNTPSQSIHEFLSVVDPLQIFREKKKPRIVVINDSDIENKINSYHLKTLKNLQSAIGKILHSKQVFDPKTSIQLQDSELVVARLISYAPEIFRRALYQASPKVIINYNESCKNSVYELYRSLKGSTLSQKTFSTQLLLQAISKILDTSLSLLER